MNTSITKEKIWRTKFWFAEPKVLTLRCHAHHGVEFFELRDQISRRNPNVFRKYFSLIIRAQMGSNHGKKCMSKISRHTPFKLIVKWKYPPPKAALNQLYTVLFLKLKQKKNKMKHFFYSFYFRTQKCPFSGVKQFFLLNFFSVSAFKTIDTQMLFWSVFLKTQKKNCH